MLVHPHLSVRTRKRQTQRRKRTANTPIPPPSQKQETMKLTAPTDRFITPPLVRVIRHNIAERKRVFDCVHTPGSTEEAEYFNSVVGHFATAELAFQCARKAVQMVSHTPFFRHDIKRTAKDLLHHIAKFDSLTADILRGEYDKDGNEALDSYDGMVDYYVGKMGKHTEILRQTATRVLLKAGAQHAGTIAALEVARVTTKLVNDLARHDAKDLVLMARPDAVRLTEEAEQKIVRLQYLFHTEVRKVSKFTNVDYNSDPDIKLALKILIQKFEHGIYDAQF